MLKLEMAQSRFFKPGLPIAHDIQPINHPWTDDIFIFQSGPPVAH